jgi:hypothetical protein
MSIQWRNNEKARYEYCASDLHKDEKADSRAVAANGRDHLNFEFTIKRHNLRETAVGSNQFRIGKPFPRC